MQSGEFKLPAKRFSKVACDICGKRMYKTSLQRHVSIFHKEIDCDTDMGTKRMLSESLKTPVVRLKRVRNHYTPLPNQEQEVMPRSRLSDKGRRSPEESTENLPISKFSDSVDKCPLCRINMPLSQIQRHFDDIHSPSRKITRQIKLPTARLPVHVSTDSPAKIRNANSPAKNLDEETSAKLVISVSESVKLRRKLNL